MRKIVALEDPAQGGESMRPRGRGTQAFRKPSPKKWTKYEWSQEESNNYRAQRANARNRWKWLRNRDNLGALSILTGSPKLPQEDAKGGENSNRFEVSVTPLCVVKS